MEVIALKHFFKIHHAVCYMHYTDESYHSHSEIDAIIIPILLKRKQPH